MRLNKKEEIKYMKFFSAGTEHPLRESIPPVHPCVYFGTGSKYALTLHEASIPIERQ